jgi:predicted nucleic acid-binding Zn ribbon protein
MKIKLSATFEGKCDFCKERKTVFTAGDEETKKVVTICEDCSKKLGNMLTEEVVEKYGHVDERVFEQGIKLHTKPIAS